MGAVPPDPFVYRSVIGLPEYRNIPYSFDWVSILTCFMLTYTFPCLFVFIKITVFFFENRAKIKQTGLRLEIFQAFLLMQFWNILWIIGEFLTFRVPYTKIFTSYCANENPQQLLKIVGFIYFFGRYTSQLFTVLFCGLRVRIIYSSMNNGVKKVSNIISVVIILLGCALSSPNYFSDGICLQVAEPYSFGAILVLSRFNLSNTKLIVFANLIFTSVITFSIIVLTIVMLRKVQERKKKLNAVQSSAQNSRIEKTLTTTMFLLLIPLMLNVSVSIGELFHVSFFSYILLLRPLFLDARVHIVTCYFYLTHPMFKKQPTATNSIAPGLGAQALKIVE